jgi:rhodanese-related sulfurtransferase
VKRCTNAQDSHWISGILGSLARAFSVALGSCIASPKIGSSHEIRNKLKSSYLRGLWIEAGDFLALPPPSQGSLLVPHVMDRLVDTEAVVALQQHWRENEQHQIALPDQRVMHGGHIPGAVHLHARRFLNPTDWSYLPPTSIQTFAGGVGLEQSQRIITYCGVGISVSLGLFALHLAGYRNSALYDASWEEWGTDSTLQVKRADE